MSRPTFEVVILAGGFGTRLRSEVPDLPKPMAPVAGRPFLEILMERCVRQGAAGFVLSVGYRHEAIVDHFEGSFMGRPVRYAVEREPLGTGGGLLLAQQGLAGEGPFLVMNGDTFLEVELAELISRHVEASADMTIALVQRSDVGRYGGVATGPEGRVLEFESRGASAVNGGVYVLSGHTLGLLGLRAGDRASLEKDVLPGLLRHGAKVIGFECRGRFIDIGVPDDYRSAAGYLGL